MYTEEWHAWAFVVVVVVPIVVALGLRLRRTGAFAALPPTHAAAAALIALFAWEALPNLPELVRIYSGLTAGLDGIPETTTRQAFLAAYVAFLAGSAVAAVGLLRRRLWAVPLGIGTSLARIGLVALVWANFTGSTDGVGIPGELFADFLVRSAMQVVPPIVTVVLLVWPLVTGRPELHMVEADAGADAIVAEPVGD